MTGTENEIVTEVSKEQYLDKLDVDITVESTGACACWRLFECVTDAPEQFLSDLISSGKCPHVTSVDNGKNFWISKRLLHMAVAANMIELTNYLLQQGCDVNSVTMTSNCTPIYLATLHRHHNMVRNLIDIGANLNLLSCKHTPLMEAVEIGDNILVDMLLENPKCDINISNDRGETALKLAASVCEGPIVSQLLKAGALPNKTDTNGRSALFDAATNGQADMVEELIAAGADVNIVDMSGACPLLFSVHQNDFVITTALLKAGANPNYQSHDGFSLLQIAIYSECNEIVDKFLEHNVDFNATNSSNYSAIHIAAWEGHSHIVDLLLKKGAEHDNRTQDGNTPLSLAVHGNHFDVVKMLLPFGCAVNNLDKDSDAPLHYATYNGCLESVKALVKEGADPNVRNRLDTTPLWNAVFNNHSSVVRYLVSLNVDLEVKSSGIDQHSNSHDVVLIYNKPMSPLWVAVNKGYDNVTSMLLEAGYNVWQEDWLSDSLYPLSYSPSRTLLATVQSRYNTPPALIHCCKMLLRRSYKAHLLDAVKELEIPNSLKDYLLLNYLL